MQLDFVLENEEPIDNLPHSMQTIVNGFIYQPSEAVAKALEKIKMAYVCGGALMTVGLDYRKAKKASK